LAAGTTYLLLDKGHKAIAFRLEGLWVTDDLTVPATHTPSPRYTDILVTVVTGQ